MFKFDAEKIRETAQNLFSDKIKQYGAYGMMSSLDFAEVPWSDNGVVANINRWYENKEPIIDRLSKHPNWDAEMLSIVTNIGFPYRQSMDTKRRKISTLIWAVKDLLTENDEQIRIIIRALDNELDIGKNIFTSERINDPDEVTFFKDIIGFSGVSLGMKYGRLFQKLVKSWDEKILEDPEFVKSYNAWTDSISESMREYKFVISVNPAAYTLMSYGNSWTSCHIINPSLTNEDGYGGCYRSGGLSYMMDGTSVISYIVNKDTANENIPYEPRILRQVIFTEGDRPAFFASRMYPQGSDNFYYELFQKSIRGAFEKMFDLDNDSWRDDGKSVERKSNRHYDDYEQFRDICTSIRHVSVPIEYDNYIAGNITICPSCGIRRTMSAGQIECGTCGRKHSLREEAEDCDELTYCTRCGDDILYEDEQFNTEDGIVCESCFDNYYSRCDDCDEYFDYSLMVTDEHTSLCQSCFEESWDYCCNCSEIRPADDMTWYNGDCYCEYCFADNFTCCASCGEPVPDTDVKVHNGEAYCEDCYEKINTEPEGDDESIA